MASNKIRHGNTLYPHDVRCSFQHGVAPAVCSIPMVTEEGQEPAFRIGETFSIQVGSNLTWEGEVRKLETSIDGRSGTVSQIEALDNRLSLQGKRVYAQYNMREDGGQLFCIKPEDWYAQEKTYKGVFARQIIIDLLVLAGFGWELSADVWAVLWGESSDFDGWELDIETRHVWNLDWNTGQAVGTALVDVCKQLGIQFSLKQGDPWTLVFTEKGENLDPNILWNGDGAVSGTKGESMGAGVDTGVHVIGDRAICDTKVTLLPAWDDDRPSSPPELPDPLPAPLPVAEGKPNYEYNYLSEPLNSLFLYWSCFAWDRVRFLNACKAADLDPLIVTVGEVNTALLGKGEKDTQPKAWHGRPVWKMRAKEYLDTFPYQLYKIPDSEDLPTITDPYTYASMTASLPLADNLVTLPNTAIRLWGPVTKLGKGGRLRIIRELEEITGGATLDREEGTVHFSKWSMKYTEEGEGRKGIMWWHLRDGEPIARIALRGPIFKREWGTTQRIGKIVMASLKRKYVCNKVGGSWDVEEKPFVWWGGDSGGAFDDGIGDPDDIGNYTHYITADEVAQVMAFAHLKQQRIIINGQKRYHGFAGHQPNGWIQKVSVQLNASQGLVTTIDFSNEIPPLYQDNIENMQRRLLDRQKQSELDIIKGAEDAKEAKEISLLMSARALAAAIKKKIDDEDATASPSEEDEAKDGSNVSAIVWVMQSTPTPCNFRAGEPVCVVSGGVGGIDPEQLEVRAVHRDDVAQNDTRVLGACTSDVEANTDMLVPVATSGAFDYLMEGDISIGDSLGTIPTSESDCGYVVMVGGGTGGGKAVTAHSADDETERGKAIVNTSLGSGGEGVVYDAFTGIACGNHGSWFYLSIADMRATTQESPTGTVTHAVHVFDVDGTEITESFPHSVELTVGETEEFTHDALPFSTLADNFYRYEVRVGTSSDGEDVAVASLYDGYWNVFQRG